MPVGFAKFFGCDCSDTPPSGGVVPGFVPVEYEGDWYYMDGIEDIGFQFQEDRVVAGKTAPTSGVKAKRGHPDQKDMVAMSVSGEGFEQTDLLFIVWAATLKTTQGALIEPRPKDFLVPSNVKWRIISARRVEDQTQWRCICRLAGSELR